ncbi:hypothetical protein NLX83_33535 [Allokutzneria sp. A3M-2-11 16]|uniref:LVIVD repeat-containing protein n=1 Tax=Allokutzneria sp. A3M-2-11 16 TaxID=2962043 RepID=UPI0020B77D8C|nr:hypothetical protein [Allokutzneria sp. A3M-2-11 16]MCP3804207.1 hypothetical protein [Allokutzneria sp. A3M-2-11 16]
MPRRFGLLTAITAVVLAMGVPAWACGDAPAFGTAPESGHSHSAGGVKGAKTVPDKGAVKNVELLGTLPEAQGAISVNFLQYSHPHRDVMIVAGEFGLRSYDITADPAKPRPLGEISMPGMWEMEDTELDPERKLIFLARDPRAFGGTTATGRSGVYIVDAADPAKLTTLTFVEIPAGHTTSCVNDCRYLWTGGPAKASHMPADWGGRPVWVTDVRDPRNPKVFPNPIDTARNDGKTDYAHDVQVDADGVAWVSGRGGVRGYWTEGLRFDPVQRKFRRATAVDPVPFAGGGISELSATSKFLHNSYRPVGRKVVDGPDVGAWGYGQTVFATEENFADGCAADGVLVISSLKGSYGGEGWRSTPEKPYRLNTIGTWSVAGQEGSDPNSGDCSAHYLDVRGKILAQSFYGQGTRFLDISDPSRPRQVGYFRPADARSWQPLWHRGLLFVADNARGVDILRFTGASCDS